MATTWKEWLQHFKWQAIATLQDKKPPNVQAATVLATVGSDGVGIFNTSNMAIAKQDNIKITKETLLPKAIRYTIDKILQKEG